MEKIYLERISKNGNVISYSFSVTEGLKDFFSGKPFIIEYQQNIETVPDSVACIPFVTNVLPLVWLSDCELVLKEIDEDFYNCLPQLKRGYEDMFPESKWLGKITVASISPCQGTEAQRSAMFFSGGLDSVQTFISHIDEKPDLISIWGSDIMYDNQDGWDKAYHHLQEVANQHHLRSVVIRSTFREFDCESRLQQVFSPQLRDSWWHGVKHGIGLLGHIAPYAYLNGISTMYIASTNCPQDGVVRCASNPTIDNHVRFANCKVVHDGFEFGRQNKIKNIVDYCKRTGEFIPLHVCWESQTGENCCHCEKCYRTMVGLIVEVEDPQNYGFDKTQTFISDFKDFIVTNKAKYVDALKLYWPYIKRRVQDNKTQLKKKSRYWKNIKWLLKIDFNNLDSINNIPFFNMRYALSKLKIYQFLHRIKNRLFNIEKR